MQWMNGFFSTCKQCLAKFTENPLGTTVTAISFEFLLMTKSRRANGGDIIMLRAILSAALLFFIAKLIYGSAALNSPAAYGSILAAMYAGLYARFASQWSYLANLYNQIKATEIRALSTLADKNLTKETEKTLHQRIAEWKAGYIEDAENLHLATKKSFAPVIWFWLQDPDVKEAYIHATPDGAARYQPLVDAVRRVTDLSGGIAAYQE